MIKQISVELAQKVVVILHQVTGDNVNFMNQEGVIIATMQPQRLHTVHEGAKRIMSGEIDELAVTVEDANNIKGVLPGYNGVITFEGKRIGCIGLSGDPDRMRPLQKMAALIVKEEYTKYIAAEKKQEILEIIGDKIRDVSQAINQITDGSIKAVEILEIVEGKADATEKYLQNIDKILDAIKKIGNQTRLLGLNASIEAARVGEHGRGFSVVAKEMDRLSTSSINSLEETNAMLRQIQESVIYIAASIRENTSIAQDQATALKTINHHIVEIEKETQNLIRLNK